MAWASSLFRACHNNGGRIGTATADAGGGVAVFRGPGGRFGDRLLVRAEVTNAYSIAGLIGITRTRQAEHPFASATLSWASWLVSLAPRRRRGSLKLSFLSG